MTIRRSWSVMALAAASLLAAPPTQAQSLLRVAPETLSRILDPHFTTSFTTRDLGYLVYDTLFAVDDKFEPKPQMVESYTVSPDKLTYTFVLRPGLKWHDGQPVTAADCVASIRRWASRDSMGQMLTRFTASLEATDAGTIKLVPEGALRHGARQPGQGGRAGAVHDARAHCQDAGQRAGQGDRGLRPLQVPRRPA